MTKRSPPPPSTAQGPRGPRGRRGDQGKQGPRGPTATRIESAVLNQLLTQMETVVRELQTQLTRIAQMQAQIDRLATGEPPQSERRRRRAIQ